MPDRAGGRPVNLTALLPGFAAGCLAVVGVLLSAPAQVSFAVPHRPPVVVAPALAHARVVHGAVTREEWVAAHGAALPAALVMVRGGQVRVVTVRQGWVLAGQGWATDGWCAR